MAGSALWPEGPAKMKKCLFVFSAVLVSGLSLMRPPVLADDAVVPELHSKSQPPVAQTRPETQISTDFLKLLQGVAEADFAQAPGAISMNPYGNYPLDQKCGKFALYLSDEFLQDQVSAAMAAAAHSGNPRELEQRALVAELKEMIPHYGRTFSFQDMYQAYNSKNKEQFIEYAKQKSKKLELSEAQAADFAAKAFDLLSRHLQNETFKVETDRCVRKLNAVWNKKKGEIHLTVSGNCKFDKLSRIFLSPGPLLEDWTLSLSGTTLPEEVDGDLVWQIPGVSPSLQPHCEGGGM